MLTEEEGRFLLKLARRAIEAYLKTGKVIDIKPSEVPGTRLTEDGACFTTLFFKGQLRGCIGSLERKRPLVFDVVDNALNAALRDPRFMPLTAEELQQVRIEISVLTVPERLDVRSAEELLDKLEPKKHGLIIQKGVAKATFLPMVWEYFPKKEEFLAQLCRKAGLRPDEWREPEKMEFYIYEAQEFME